MNGLEAIELMKQGKMIKGGIWIYGTDSDGVIWLKNESCTGWVEAEMFNILANDYEEYIEPKPLTGWERNMGGNLYSVLAGSGVEDIPDTNSHYDNRVYEVANYFSTREKAEEIDFKQTLFRKLQRFSDENGGNEIDWNDRESLKYFIRYDDVLGRFIVDTYCNYRNFGQIYFTSRGVADRAVELFRDDLIKYFTHDWSGENE